ncbi:MAG: RodZ domain-containing protein [Tistlia sp.]|uniref:RodZ domain-containing protein n=1 Tax=Tistlia sp. TaxID=3057121 RepID=UPI0034A1B18E
MPPSGEAPLDAAGLPASESAREVSPLGEPLRESPAAEATNGLEPGTARRPSVPEAPAGQAVLDVAPLPTAEPELQAAREPEPQTTLAREQAEAIPVPPIPTAANGEEPGRAARVFGTANTDARIVLRATADSWVQVRNASSDLLFTQVLRAGDSYNVPNEQGLTLLTGNAGGLQVLVDGQAVPALGPSGTVRRDIELEPGSLLQGAQ